MAPDKIYTTESHHGWYETNDGGDKIEYIRKDVVKQIIRSALGPQDALNKLNSL